MQAPPSLHEIEETLRETARAFPEGMVDDQLRDIPRVAFQLDLILRRAEAGVALCDIGSGVGLFPAVCAKLGFETTMMDDFAHPYAEGVTDEDLPDVPDAINYARADQALAFHRSLGVHVIQRDPLIEGLGFGKECLGIVTSFDSMEHWHQSPKRLFASIIEALVPGGLFILGGPNCVNLRKRLTVPMGYGKWSQIAHWYEPERFRGHVREPDVDDLLYIARDMGLVDVEILGRNWTGYASSNRFVRFSTKLADRILQLRPTLCSDLYLVGRKPKAR